MPNYSADDIVDLKNKKKRRKRIIKLVVFLAAVMIAATLYATKDSWIPELRGIGRQYKTIVNSGQLAKGNFPIEIDGETGYQLRYTDEKIAVLNDTYLYIYNTEGNLLKKRQHAYMNSVLCSANGRFLVYENGGSKFTVEDDETVFYNKAYDDKNILFVRISSQGYTAAVTTSDNYNCEISIYDNKGKFIYGRKCTEMVSDVSFINNSTGCKLSFVRAENGQLTTCVQELDLSSRNGEKWTSPGLNTLGLDLSATSESAFVYGDKACGFVDDSGKISSFYTYDGDTAGGASAGGKAVVAVNNDDTRKYTAALFADDKSEPLTIELDSPAVDVAVYGGLAYVMCRKHITAYDFDGKVRSTVDVSDSYDGFVKGKDHIFLKGYNKIDRIDFESGE